MLAFFTKRANLKGVYVGMVACILFSVWAVLSGEPLVGDKSLIDLNQICSNLFNTTAFGTLEGQTSLNFPHHHYMIGVYSHIVLFVFGYVASLFFKHKRDITGLTFYDWRKRGKSVAEMVEEKEEKGKV
jgi:SSS family solute:Na+ symporter